MSLGCTDWVLTNWLIAPPAGWSSSGVASWGSGSSTAESPLAGSPPAALGRLPWLLGMCGSQTEVVLEPLVPDDYIKVGGI